MLLNLEGRCQGSNYTPHRRDSHFSFMKKKNPQNIFKTFSFKLKVSYYQGLCKFDKTL